MFLHYQDREVTDFTFTCRATRECSHERKDVVVSPLDIPAKLDQLLSGVEVAFQSQFPLRRNGRMPLIAAKNVFSEELVNMPQGFGHINCHSHWRSGLSLRLGRACQRHWKSGPRWGCVCSHLNAGHDVDSEKTRTGFAS